MWKRKNKKFAAEITVFTIIATIFHATLGFITYKAWDLLWLAGLRDWVLKKVTKVKDDDSRIREE